MYGLTLKGVTEEIETEDGKWCGVIIKSLLKRWANMKMKGKGKLMHLLKIQEVAWLVGMEAGEWFEDG